MAGGCTAVGDHRVVDLVVRFGIAAELEVVGGHAGRSGALFDGIHWNLVGMVV